MTDRAAAQVRSARSRRAVAAMLLVAPLTLAGQEAAQVPIIDAPQGTPGLGGGFRLGSDPYREGDLDLDLVPLYLYQGKHLYAYGTQFGVYMYRNGFFEADAFARYRFNHLDPDDDPYLEGLEEREQSVDAGLSVGFRGKWGQVKLEWMTDVLDRSDGQEANLVYRYRFDRGRWMFSPFVNLVWQDADLTDYYFGVSSAEARVDRPAYAPGDSLGLQYGMNTSYQMDDKVLFFFNFGFTEFDREVADSPIVEEAIQTTLFFGATYMFGSVYDPTVSPERELTHKWSWRVNYGYQAEGNIVGEIDQGDFSRSTVADTRIGGFTYSRLVNAGEQIDFYGRLALFRHFERGAQDDFFSVSAYMMAFGKGFFRYKDEPAFRWGFGFGFSYAQEVPIVEQLKQGARDRETNRFLNYLEMQLDFPIYKVVKGRWIEDCYTGVTLVHRSGIFATSDILGNVAGGSDWITAHLECLR